MDRVYRGWNTAGLNAPGDVLIFVNSDFAYTPLWIDKLLAHYHGSQLPCSRLVESGKLLSGQWGISKDFGKTPSGYLPNETSFLRFAESISRNLGAEPGGLYMPCVISKEIFVNSGGYPEGNVKHSDGKIISGDAFFFEKLHRDYGLVHVTAMDSIVYHFQEGEKDEQ